jgi:hypothetical protein
VCPERNGLGTFAKNEDIAFRYLLVRQTGKGVLNEASGNAAPAMGSGDRQMMEVPPPAIVAAKDSAHDFAMRRFRYGAEARIAQEKGRHAFLGVGFTEANTFASLPKSHDVLVIGDIHCANKPLCVGAEFIAPEFRPLFLIRWHFSAHHSRSFSNAPASAAQG